jgi:hypothetical protein
MNKLSAPLFMFFSRINRQHIQLVFVLIVLAMLALGAGAPDDGGSIPR